jgi:adenylate kinase
LELNEIQLKYAEAVEQALEHREDDDEEVFSNRMRIYKDTIEEIESFYEGRGLLTVIDGERELDQVVHDIDTFLTKQVTL